MSFLSLPQAIIAVGKPIVKRIFQSLKDNQDDLNARVLTVEANVAKIVFYDGLVGSGATYASATGLLLHRVESSIDLTDCKVGVLDFTGITSGVLEVDVQKSTTMDFTSSVSVFTTKPSLDLSTASNYDESANMVLNSNKTLVEGDFLRLDISSLPLGLGRFQLYLIGEPS